MPGPCQTYRPVETHPQPALHNLNNSSPRAFASCPAEPQDGRRFLINATHGFGPITTPLAVRYGWTAQVVTSPLRGHVW